MQTALIIGSTRATVKHESLTGQRMVIVEPLMQDETPDGPPLIAIDAFGAQRGDHVMLTSDGLYAREITDNENTPVRWSVMGILD